MYDCQQLQLMYQVHQVKNDNDYTQIKSRIKEEKKWWYGTGVNMSKKLQNNRPARCAGQKEKKPFTLTFRICINTPSGSSSRECCIPAQDCFKGSRLAAVAEPQAPQVGTIEPSKVEKAISISATLWATTEAPAEPEQSQTHTQDSLYDTYFKHGISWHTKQSGKGYCQRYDDLQGNDGHFIGD